MSIPDISLFSQLSSSLDDTLSNIQTVEQQLGTGKSVIEPSDNPVAYAGAQLLTTQQSAVNNDLSLAQQSQGRLTTLDNTLATVTNEIDAASATATQGADGSLSTAQMQTLATQAQSILTQVIGAGNTQYEGAYLFAGSQVLTPPYNATGTYAGDSATNSVTFSDGTQVQMSFDGQSVFGDNTNGLISALTSLVSNLNSGNHAGVSATLPQLQTALQTLAETRSSIGSNLDTLSNVVTNSNNKIVTYQTTESNLVDADVAQEAMQEQETTLQQQALVQLGSTLGKIPLLNILA
ncbi:MAG TPA: flagellin [Candidatus Binataceae bacterium]|nr:flagellin [Candidatus Binataceae bacterium]